MRQSVTPPQTRISGPDSKPECARRAPARAELRESQSASGGSRYSGKEALRSYPSDRRARADVANRCPRRNGRAPWTETRKATRRAEPSRADWGRPGKATKASSRCAAGKAEQAKRGPLCFQAWRPPERRNGRER